MNSKKEFAQAMLDGRKFGDYSEGICYFDENEENPFVYVSGYLDHQPEPITRYWDDYDELEEILSWYEKIPKTGVLCWVWGGDINKGDAIQLVSEYKKESFSPFKTALSASWSHAEPLTKEEALGRLYD